MDAQVRGKRAKRVGQIKAELAKNHRLSSVYRICEMLHIDDPVFWMNNTSPAVVDGWVAYLIFKSEVENGDVGNKMSPTEASTYLSSLVK